MTETAVKYGKKKAAKEPVRKMNDKEWLDKKSRSIGGSEVAAILGMNPYMTAIDVYMNKVEGKQTESRVIMRAGNLLEPLVAELFEEETGYEVRTPASRLYVHPEYEFLVGTPDRFFNKNEYTGVLECKTTSLNYDSIPDFWQLQNMWYMGIVGKTFGAVAYLKNNRAFGFAEYEFNQELFEAMVDAAVTFWHNHVEQRIPPAITENNLSEVSKIYRAHVDGLKIKATSETVSLLNNYVAVKKIKKLVEEKETELANKIKFILKDSEALVDDQDNILATWKKNKDSRVFDMERFKAENPELIIKYMIDRAGARPLLPKEKNLTPDLTEDGIKSIINNQILLTQ